MPGLLELGSSRVFSDELAYAAACGFLRINGRDIQSVRSLHRNLGSRLHLHLAVGGLKSIFRRLAPRARTQKEHAKNDGSHAGGLKQNHGNAWELAGIKTSNFLFCIRVPCYDGGWTTIFGQADVDLMRHQ